MQPNWFIDIIRELFFVFDKIVYNLIDLVYQLFMSIAETGIFRAEDIRSFAERIYFFLGLIMVFKVSISIIQFIANPDSAKDGKVGAPKLLKNLVVILVGIILIPYVFEAAYSLQRLVLRDNVIGNLILGMNYSEDKKIDGDTEQDFIKSAGKRMAFTTFTAFFHLDTDIVGASGTELFNNACAANPFTKEGNVNPECSDDGKQVIDDFLRNKEKNKNFQVAYAENNFNYLQRMQISYEIEDYNNEDKYLFDYSILISTAAGVFIIWILLGFCVDVAIRNVKLGFLQLIAPIPLIAKIDPQKGDETFNKWVKECTSTYLNLFGRLIAIYFAVFLLSLITGGFINVVSGEESNPNIFVKVFFIFGILTFAKDLPNVLKKLFPGLELDGKGLGLKNKLNQTPIVGAAANKALGLAGRTGLNLAKGVGRATGKGLGKVGKGLGNKIGGTRLGGKIGGAARNVGVWASGKAQVIGNRASKIGNAVNSITGNAMSDIGLDARGTFRGMGASIEDSLGLLESRKNQILNRQSAGKVEMEKNKKLADAISSMETRALERIKSGAGGTLSMRFNQETAQIEKMKNMSVAEWADPSNGYSYDEDGNSLTQEQAVAQAQYKLDNWLNSNDDDGAASQYIDGIVSGSFKDSSGASISADFTDGTLKDGMYKGYIAQAEANGIASPSNTGATIHKTLANAKTKNSEIQREQMADNNEISKIDEKIRSAKEFSSKK